MCFGEIDRTLRGHDSRFGTTTHSKLARLTPEFGPHPHSDIPRESLCMENTHLGSEPELCVSICAFMESRDGRDHAPGDLGAGAEGVLGRSAKTALMTCFSECFALVWAVFR